MSVRSTHLWDSFPDPDPQTLIVVDENVAGMPEPVKPRPACALAPTAATRAHRTHAGAPPKKAVDEKQIVILKQRLDSGTVQKTYK